MQCIACLLTATVLYVGECANRNKQRVSEYGCEGFDFDFADGDKIRPWQEPGIKPTPPINMFALKMCLSNIRALGFYFARHEHSGRPLQPYRTS